MGKLIIDNRTNLPDPDVFKYVAEIVDKGRQPPDFTRYQHVTNFHLPHIGSIKVVTDINDCSDRFLITEETPQQEELLL